MVGSAEGGMDIETVARTNPEAIIKEGIDIKTGMCSTSAGLSPVMEGGCEQFVLLGLVA